MRKKFTIEIILLLLTFIFTPLAFKQFYLEPNAAKAANTLQQLLATLVYIPSESDLLQNRELYFSTEPSSQKVLIHNGTFVRNGGIYYKWQVDSETVSITVTPAYNIERSGERLALLHVRLTKQPEEFKDIARIVRDERMKNTFLTTHTEGINLQFYNQQPDGLVSLSSYKRTGIPYVDCCEWDFERKKLPYNLAATIEKLNLYQYRAVEFVIPGFFSLLNPGSPSDSLLLRSILSTIPLLLAGLLAYLLVKKMFHSNNIIKLNIIFLVLLLVFNFVYHFVQSASYYGLS